MTILGFAQQAFTGYSSELNCATLNIVFTVIDYSNPIKLPNSHIHLDLTENKYNARISNMMNSEGDDGYKLLKMPMTNPKELYKNFFGLINLAQISSVICNIQCSSGNVVDSITFYSKAGVLLNDMEV